MKICTILSQSPVSIITCQIHRENLTVITDPGKRSSPSKSDVIERCLRLGASDRFAESVFWHDRHLEVSARRRLSGIRVGSAGRSQRLSQMCSKAELWYRWQQRRCMPEPDRDPGLYFRSWCSVPKK
ncbi:STY4526/YPO1902 family pathogenicity island replication protein [Proteus mirabilis]